MTEQQCELAAGALPYLDAGGPQVPIHHEEGFLDAGACRTLVTYFEANAHLTARTGLDYWDGRVMNLAELPPEDGVVRNLMEGARRAIRQRLAAHFQPGRPLHSDTIQLNVWPSGFYLDPHCDNCDPDGTPNHTPWRDLSAVVYLNEDYEGGDLWLPRLGFRVRPRTGLLVGFRAGLEHQHGVTPIRHGRRYTMPTWFSTDPARAAFEQ